MIPTNPSISLIDSYWRIAEYHRRIKDLYRFLDMQLGYEENGLRLRPMPENTLFTYLGEITLDDYPPYPCNAWLAPWYGRFYVDAGNVPEGISPEDCSGEKNPDIAFVWNWIGCNDPNVADVEESECWFCVTKPEPENPSESLGNIARMIWNDFRIELTSDQKDDDWLMGRFHREKVGCSLNGFWFLQRMPLSRLSTPYQVQNSIVRPLRKKFLHNDFTPRNQADNFSAQQ
uniref:Uncharacterized protein n=1 Tax=Candidatus Kentrum eta TaxID=2126337 RepID=A0A450VIQ0_9GAMM|nr:MAG: hypothetical protein BECKH772B_GA0070898_104412 [Candidatus Kentron sp. H]VFK04610.1 MAG: hypothetical protein BECKH772A_GA0070896_104372 [Candidatus Kentron sp. H]VFK07670.1 MAG: hypothetical protein BECKH772C_GA0070978_104442 [Candidatus Kentron sp. H]